MRRRKGNGFYPPPIAIPAIIKQVESQGRRLCDILQQMGYTRATSDIPPWAAAPQNR